MASSHEAHQSAASTPSTAQSVAPVLLTRNESLPIALLVLTLVTGLVDAVSYLGLGHVFTANMTGNVVLLGFAVSPSAWTFRCSLINFPDRVSVWRGSWRTAWN
jgi:hypothetical protein